MTNSEGKGTVLSLSILLNVLLLAGFIIQGVYMRNLVVKSYADSAGNSIKLQQAILADLEKNTPEKIDELKQMLRFNIDVENRYRYKIETGAK
jgi:hypothetical protein